MQWTGWDVGDIPARFSASHPFPFWGRLPAAFLGVIFRDSASEGAAC